MNPRSPVGRVVFNEGLVMDIERVELIGSGALLYLAPTRGPCAVQFGDPYVVFGIDSREVYRQRLRRPTPNEAAMYNEYERLTKELRAQ